MYSVTQSRMLSITKRKPDTPIQIRAMFFTVNQTNKVQKLLKTKETHTLEKFHSSTRLQERPTKIQTFLERKKPMLEQFNRAVYPMKKVLEREHRTHSKAVFLEKQKLKDLAQELKTLSKAQFLVIQSKILPLEKSLVGKVVELRIFLAMLDKNFKKVHKMA